MSFEEIFEDVLVIELASVLAGPAVGMFMAELGARVIKVENPATKGDVTRSWKLGSESPESSISAYFSSVNWGKESILIDIKQEKGKKLVHHLIEKADIVISSYLPGSARRLDMDADTLCQLNPQLIHAQITGYGPDVERAAFDAIIQAEAGFTYMNGIQPGQEHKMPVALMDILAAHQLKEAILLAYIARMRTGKGNQVSVSLIDAALSSLANQATNWLHAVHIPTPQGSEHPNIVPYGTIYTTRDQKKMVLAVGNDRQFAALCEVFKVESKEEWKLNQARVKDRTAVNQKLQEVFSDWDLEDLLSAMNRNRIPAGAVNDMKAVFEQKYASRFILNAEGARGIRNSAITQNQKLLQKELSRPPKPGEHSDAILSGILQQDEDSIFSLKSEEIVH